jgi:hypothetical protein
MLLSVVVTIVDGGDTLRRCLAALVAQLPEAAMEILVPYDDTVPAMDSLIAELPQVTFLDVGSLPTALPKMSAGGQHELFDRRRAAGLAQAKGELVAILEDRGVPRANWASEVRRAHSRLPDLVIGGAIENGTEGVLNWAVYFCDFGRYQRPFAEGPRAFVSDVNICYKREALERTRSLWRTRYHEPVVHDALVHSGARLILSPDLVVDQRRDHLTISGLLRERIAWGRLFATLRVREKSLASRLAMAALTPVLPVLLFLRLARMQWQKRVSRRAFLVAAPCVLLLLCAWSFGEFLGYLTGRTSRAR